MSIFNKLKVLVPNIQISINSDVKTVAEEKPVKTEESPSNSIKTAITEKMDVLFNDVLNDKEGIEKKHATLSKGKEIATSLISKASNKCATIAGASSLIPGPWGMLAILPEMYLVIRIQIELVRDLSIAYGYKDKLNKELLAYLFATSLGTGDNALAVTHGGKTEIKRATLQVMQKIVHHLAGKITQGVIKSAASKWVPLAGPALLGAWTLNTTKEIGRICCEQLERDLVISDEFVDEAQFTLVEINESNSSNDKKMESFKVMINLAVSDGVSEEEKKHLAELLENSDLAADEIQVLNANLLEAKPFNIDFEIFNTELDRILLLENLHFVSLLDGVVSEEEKQYINFVREKLLAVKTVNI